VPTRYEDSGRTRQKQRTRDELVAAARALVASGGSAPTVEAAAAAASISRATAYRYFPNQRALLTAAHPETVRESLLPPDAGDDPRDRLLLAVASFLDMIVATEQQQRTMLRLSIDSDRDVSDLPLRRGRAIGWFEEALRPLESQLGAAAVHRVATVVRSAVGIESLVWLTDVAGLSRDDAKAAMLWSAEALLDQALSAGPPPDRQVSRRARRARRGSGSRPGRA
jgi:AcrR family transcriptional regulator